MNRTEARLLGAIAVAMTVASIGAPTASAQATAGTFKYELFADSPAESYLRYLQTTGAVKEYPWSSRGFSQRELRALIPRDTANPWHARLVDAGRTMYGIRYGLIQPSASIRYNSRFAYGSNDGPIWAGRGLTSAAQFGFYASWNAVTLTVAPMAFRAENQGFDILPTGHSGNQSFADPQLLGIDKPQRFGSSAYSQLDPGQTTLRVDLPFLSFGASTADQAWGPGQELPVILGNNAGGFPHVFVGSSEPLNIFIAKLHGKVIWGKLFQSDYSPVTGPDRYISPAEPGTVRFATGFVFSAQPRGLPGLELGAARFFHSIWPVSGIPSSYYTKFLQGFLKKQVPRDQLTDPRFPALGASRGIADNQLVSVFGRWVLPHSGFEVHGEYGREDHSYDFRDLFQEPDHSRVYSLGARKVFQSSSDRLIAGRVEVMNFQLPQLSRYRGEGEIYMHGLLRQGHTYKGQLLGADAGVGTGAGSVVAVDQFSTNGRWTASWQRIVRRENGNYLSLGVQTPRSIDVTHALGFEMSRFMRGLDITGGLTFVADLNHNFKSDEINLNALLGVRYLLR